MKYDTIIGDIKIREAQHELGKKTWPEFIRHDLVVEEYWHKLYTEFLHCQFAYYSNENLIGVGNSIPLNWKGDFNDLPDQGLDWAIKKAVDDRRNNLTPNLLIGMQILIDPTLQSKGLSYEFLETMKQIARTNRYSGIALPVRPTQKFKYPLISMEDYIQWKDDNGKPFDSWIRVHTNAGGQIVSICNESMNIQGKVSDWERWTGLTFKSSGEYIVNRALCPIRIDLEKNLGEYIEPNIWIVHQLD